MWPKWQTKPLQRTNSSKWTKHIIIRPSMKRAVAGRLTMGANQLTLSAETNTFLSIWSIRKGWGKDSQFQASKVSFFYIFDRIWIYFGSHHLISLAATVFKLLFLARISNLFWPKNEPLVKLNRIYKQDAPKSPIIILRQNDSSAQYVHASRNFDRSSTSSWQLRDQFNFRPWGGLNGPLGSFEQKAVRASEEKCEGKELRSVQSEALVAPNAQTWPSRIRKWRHAPYGVFRIKRSLNSQRCRWQKWKNILVTVRWRCQLGELEHAFVSKHANAVD